MGISSHVYGQLVANLAGHPRRQVWNGRRYIVAPMTLIVPGVLPGSRGALYYPDDEVRNSVPIWNNAPIVINHPVDPMTGTPISANDDGVWERSGVGVVRNTAFVDGKLRGEGWFDEELLRQKHPATLNKVERGEKVEISTGLFTDNEESPGMDPRTGRAYDAIARNYRRDHLAILPDQAGACNVRDGCGVNNVLTCNCNGDVKCGPCSKKAKEGEEELVENNPSPTPQAATVPPSELGMKTLNELLGNSNPEGINQYSAGSRVKHNGGSSGSSRRGQVGTVIKTDKTGLTHRVRWDKGGETTEWKSALDKHEPTSNAHPEQGRCPEKGTFQPKRFKGKGRGEVHKAVEAGHANTGVTNSNPEGHNQYTKGGGKDKTEGDLSLKSSGEKAPAGLKVKISSSASSKKNGLGVPHIHAGKTGTVVEHNPELGSVSMKLDGGGHIRVDHKHVYASNSQNLERSLAALLITAKGGTMTREQMIEQLGKTSAWKGSPLLNQLSEVQLTDLVQKEVVINAVREGFGDVTINEMPAALKKAQKAHQEPDGDEEEEDGEEPTGNARRPQTEKEWFESAPPAIQKMALNYARAVNNQKKALVDRLVANVSSDRQAAARERFMKKDIEDLEDMLLVANQGSPASSEAETFASFFGANAQPGPVINQSITAQAEEFALPQPGDHAA